MRIGEFSKKNEINAETIRYYMELGLIVPLKIGSYYQFGSNAQEDLERILAFKNMGFTLSEIKKIFHFHALSRMHSSEEKEYYTQFFKSNLEKIQEELRRLKNAEMLVSSTLDNIIIEDDVIQSVIGVPLRILHLLSCPKCHGDLMLKQGQVVENKIVEGDLSCSCGEVYKIKEGILVIDATHIEIEYYSESNLRVEYYTSTSEEYIDKIYISSRWLINVMLESGFTDKSEPFILEPGIGTAYALTQCLHAIPDNSVYFAVDNNMVRLEETKKYMERSKMNFDLVLVGSDFLNIPLKKKTVDVLMDMSGSSNRAFDNDVFLLDDIEALFKEDLEIFGMYLLAEGIHEDKIPSEFHHLFTKKVIKKKLMNLDIDVTTELETGKITTGGPYESYIDFVDSSWSYCCHGKRKK